MVNTGCIQLKRQGGIGDHFIGAPIAVARKWSTSSKRSYKQERKVKTHSEVGAKKNQIPPGISSDHRGCYAGWYRFDRTGYSSVE